MFENFTFAAQAQTSWIEPEDISASPTDTTCLPEEPTPTAYPFPELPGPINDIVNQMSHSTLQAGNLDYNSPICPDLFDNDDDDDPFTEAELSYVSTTRGFTSIGSTKSAPETTSFPRVQAPPPCRRLQRQVNTKLQISSSHIRDINALVEDMISSSSQCTLRKSAPQQYFSSPPQSSAPMVMTPMEDLVVDELGRELAVDEDEGFAEMEDEISLRRASAPSGIRKTNGVPARYKNSIECLNNRTACRNTGKERLKIRSLPRMRKRKVERVVEECYPLDS